MYSILLIEDSEDSYHLAHRALGPEYEITWCKSYQQAVNILETKSWDMILLDIVLPDGNGFDLAAKIQNDLKLKLIPLIFLTTQSTLSDRVLGFDIGADDYICKPYEPLELKARVRSRLKKQDIRHLDNDIKHYGDLEIHVSTQKVYINVDKDKQLVDLTPNEFKILIFLTRESKQTVTREKLIEAVWGKETHIINRNVDTHISKLRKKLGAHGEYIRSVHGAGYQFIF